MKYKFKRFWEESGDLVTIGICLLFLFGLMMFPYFANQIAQKNNPMDSTSVKDIKAKSLEYKGHKYLLFERTNLVGPISVIHDPDCCK